MISDYRDILLGLACIGHFCWGAVGLFFLLASFWVSRKQPQFPTGRE